MDEFLQREEELMRYLDGEMTAAEKQAFELELKNNATLSEELLQLQIAKEAIAQAGRTTRVKSIHQEMMATMKPGRKSVAPVRKLVWRSMAVAASILVLVAGIGLWWMYNTNSDEIFQNNFTDYTVSTTRSNDSSSDIRRLYAGKAYSDVIKKASQQKITSEDSLLVALSYVQNSQPSSSLSWLNALANAEGKYKQDAEYYLAFAYLRLGDYNKSLELLEKIHADEKHLYHQQVYTGLIWKVRALKWKE